MPAPITLPTLEEQQRAKLKQRYQKAADTETRTRYQMLVLAQLGHTAPLMVLRSEDTVARVLKCFLSGGLDAVPRRTGALAGGVLSRRRGRAELLRVIELDPHEVGQETANWTTELLADYLGQQTEVRSRERRCVSACTPMAMSASDRPGRDVRHAEEKADYVGKDCG